MTTWLVTQDGDDLSVVYVPLAPGAAAALNQFIAENVDALNERLAPHGITTDRIVLPKWKRVATLLDIGLAGDIEQNAQHLDIQAEVLDRRATDEQRQRERMAASEAEVERDEKESER